MHEITLAEPCDAVAIARLVNEAYRVEDFFKVGDRTDAREIGDLLEQDRFFIVRDDDDEPAGSVYVAIKAGRGYFGMLSVHPRAQGSGLGRRLIEAAEAFCLERGCREMDLWVVNLRDDLKPWYGKLGYRESGTEPWPADEMHRLSRPAHFVVMSKQLVPSNQRELVNG